MVHRVFITGASGFIGTALRRRFAIDGWETAGVDLVAVPGQGIVAGDIGAPGAWQDAASESDLVIHTAAIVSNAADDDSAWRINVLGTKHAVDAAARAGATLVHFSSVRAYSDLGFPDGVTEDHPVRTDGNNYVDTKVAGEQVVLQAHAAGQVDARIVRPGDVYGLGSRPWTLIPLELIKVNQFLLPNMGKGIFSPIYIDDLADGVCAVATQDTASGQVFNISGGVGVTCAEFFGSYYRMLGKRGPVVVPTAVAMTLARGMSAGARVTRRSTEANAISVAYLTRTGTYSIEKAHRLLGFEPSVDLTEGMARTEQGLRAEGLLPTR